MPKTVQSSVSYWRQLVAVGTAVLTVALLFYTSVVRAVTDVLWVPSMLVGVLAAAVVWPVWKYRVGRIAWRSVYFVIAAAMLAAVGFFLYVALVHGNFNEDVIGWLQATLFFACTPLFFLLPAVVVTACVGYSFDKWCARAMSGVHLLLAVYFVFVEPALFGVVPHTEDFYLTGYVLVAVAAVCAVSTWLLKTTKWPQPAA